MRGHEELFPYPVTHNKVPKVCKVLLDCSNSHSARISTSLFYCSATSLSSIVQNRSRSNSCWKTIMATEEEQQEQQRKQKGFFLQQWLADRVQQGNRELESQLHLLLQQFSHFQQSQAGGKKTKNNNKVSFASLNTMGAALAGRGRRNNRGRQQQGGFASLSASGIEPKVKVVISPSPSSLHL